MNFKELMLHSKENDRTAISEMLAMYRPLLIKESITDGIYDEDLYQELCLTLLVCIQRFRV